MAPCKRGSVFDLDERKCIETGGREYSSILQLVSPDRPRMARKRCKNCTRNPKSGRLIKNGGQALTARNKAKAVTCVSAPGGGRTCVHVPKERRRGVRPSPSSSAALFAAGTRKRGQDGRMWRVVKTSAGVRRWARV